MGVSPRSKKEAFAVPFAVTCVLKVKNTAALSGVVRPPVDGFWNGRDTIWGHILRTVIIGGLIS